MTNTIDPGSDELTTSSSNAIPEVPRCPESGTDREKLRVLERHVDHLMGQLYHQVSIIHAQRAQVAHLEEQLNEIEDTPRLLDQSLQKIAQLKEDLAGRKEVELDLRRRIEDLEREEQNKEKHIKRLENYLNKFWYSPHRRFLRTMKNTVRGILGRKDPDGSDDRVGGGST